MSRSWGCDTGDIGDIGDDSDDSDNGGDRRHIIDIVPVTSGADSEGMPMSPNSASNFLRGVILKIGESEHGVGGIDDIDPCPDQSARHRPMSRDYCEFGGPFIDDFAWKAR